ncbi:MAG: penicillin-binding protein 2 [Deltaproteobacteria bacterium]|uniref:Penicillin-binding protein 2 n=1 Tax=Candidatus Zymogenus saltonus TaxID=2844893 RepID=A0A9D8PQC0_9DELT|nr:penicillin-binding protein 2 [Candidatus Zymogenus saltonus]
MVKIQKNKDRRKINGEKWLRFRSGVVLVIFLTFFLVIIARITNLMLINGGTLYSYAERQHRVISTFVTRRGNICDVNGQNLAVSVEMESVCAYPGEVKDPEKAADLLSGILPIERKLVLKRLKGEKSFVWVKRRVSPSQAKRIKDLKLDGVGFVKEDKRFYPHRTLASHVVGFAGIDSQGLAGIEYKLDGDLKSTKSHYIAVRDAKGERLFGTDLSETDALRNCDVTLTVDVWAQYIAERELRSAVRGSYAQGGVAIVMNPATGEILAMASFPEFDPNIFERYPKSSWRNRAISMNFEPGSTFKIFLVSSVLEDEIAGVEETLYCEGGGYEVMNTMFHDHGGSFGMLSVSDIVTYSSNIGAIKLGMKLGKKRYFDYLTIFGFGKSTGIMLPGEERGFIPPVSSINEVDLAALSFGHGLSVTPIQLITAAAAIANGGFLMEPHVVKRITRSDGDTVYEANPKIVRRVMGDETAKKVREIMLNVVESGTGGGAKVPGFSVAGKTGTAQIFDSDTGTYSETEFIASFVGFIPSEEPRLAILVVVDRPKTNFYGGSVAAPAFSKIAADTMRYLKIYPEEMLKRGDEIRKREKTDLSPLM